MLCTKISIGTSRLISSSKSEAAPKNKVLGSNPPPSSSQASYPLFSPQGEKRSRSAAHPLPSEPAYAGLRWGPES